MTLKMSTATAVVHLPQRQLGFVVKIHRNVSVWVAQL